MELKQINNIVVKPIKLPTVPIDKIKGNELFPDLNAQIFLLAKKKSGKTVTVARILKECANRNTVVYIFASTVYKDPTYKVIVKKLLKRKIVVHAFTSLYADGENQLMKFLKENKGSPDDFMKLMKDGKDEKKEVPKEKVRFIMANDDSEDEEEKVSKYKPTKIAPEFIFIFDDLGIELDDPYLQYFMTQNRHYLNKVIISNQYWNKLAKSARAQLDFVLLWPNIPKDKLKEVYQETDLSITEPEFIRMYQKATAPDVPGQKSFNFLYVDIRNQVFRKNFNKQFPPITE